jgi:hypothetical protein
MFLLPISLFNSSFDLIRHVPSLYCGVVLSLTVTSYMHHDAVLSLFAVALM